MKEETPTWTNPESTRSAARSQGGFYIPPPGYQGSRGQSEKPPRSTAQYGGNGVYDPLPSRTDVDSWLPILRSQGQVSDVFSRLVQSEWTIPQAQRVLSTWATLATLLAGTQTTLLTFYERDKTSTYIAISFAALFLEIYGALLAAINIMVSISLQASQASHDAKDGRVAAAQISQEDLQLSQGFKWHWMDPATSAKPAPPSRSVQREDGRAERRNRRASSIALCVLDRLTVSCGMIIPVGGMLQLTGLTIYAMQTHPGPAVYSLLVAIFFALSMTLFGLGQGLYTGNQLYKRNSVPAPRLSESSHGHNDDDHNHETTQHLMRGATLNSVVIH